ncbi:hypothetical protein OBBRIDRAFT_697877, partial [Obba rivulosa]
IPKLPPELTDRIIDFLHDDPHSLTKCSLTCRSWMSVSRYQVYHSLTHSRL